MGSLNEYRCALQRVLQEYAEYIRGSGDVEVEVIADTDAGHYALIEMGWQGLDRIHNLAIHVDIHDDKLYVQHDTTEEGIANELVEAGVPRDRIVLAFKPPDIRPYTDFAVA